MSSSPAAKRNLKPSPIAPATQYIATDSSAALPAANPGVSAFGPPLTPGSKKRKASMGSDFEAKSIVPATAAAAPSYSLESSATAPAVDVDPPQQPVPKRGRTNTPWTAAEEKRLKEMREAGNSWSEIAKTFPLRTEGSVKKHWYKDMHYAEFGEDESAALLAAIKEYDANKWKHIGAKLGKPAKACESYAKEHFGGRV